MESDNSVLADILRQVYSRYDGKSVSLHPNITLTLYNQNRQQGQYLTDGTLCMMFEFPSNRKPHIADPFNKVRCPYYNVFKGCHKFFNCPDNKIDDSRRDMKNPIPYDPFFHFSEQWHDYQKERAKFEKVKCSTIIIASCDIFITNIANTGYFAPVMKVISSKKGSDVYVNPSNIHSVLFHQPTVSFCFNLWRKQSRERIFSRNPLQPFSLISIKVKKEVTEANQIVDYDQNHELLKYQPRQKDKSVLILMSDSAMSGDYYCNQDLPYEVVKIKQDNSTMSFENRQNNIVYPNNIFKEQSESSSIDLQDSDEVMSIEQQKRSESEQEQEDEDDDNILEKLYKKALQLSREEQGNRMVPQSSKREQEAKMAMEPVEEDSISLSDD